MRLTLRTLLAYMDGILDPADQEDLAKQVESSEVASDLVHRARDTTRRLRLPAPPVIDDPTGFGANVVAEYLDNTADAQAVAEFERHCLESDQHLAEVASCHHILTMVLGERAEVDAETRRRMYAIPEVAEALAKAQAAATAAAAAGTPASSPVVAPVGHRAEAHEVPDYLRGSSMASLMRWLPAIAALLLLAVVAYGAFRPGGWLQGDRDVVADGGAKPDGGEIDDAIGASDTDADDDEGGEAMETVEADPVGGDAEGDDAAGDTGDAGTGGGDLQGGESVDPDPPTGPTGGDNPGRLPSEGGTDEGGTRPIDPSDVTPPRLPTPDDAVGDPTTGPPVPPTGGGQVDGGEGDEGDSGDEGEEGDGAPEGPLPPTPVGQLASTAQVLLRYHAEDASWRRLPLRSVVMTGDRLLALPTYHPSITFSTEALNLTAELVDGTLLEVDQQRGEPVALRLDYGRLILSNPAGAPAEVRLVIGDTDSRVTLASRALLAIAAARPFVPGVDPIQMQAPIQAVCYAPQGGVTWASKTDEFTLEEPGKWQIAGLTASPVEPIESALPDWIDGRSLMSWEKLATGPIENRITTGEPVWPQLMEVFTAEIKSMKERATLAAICSAHVGHFYPFVKALANEDQRNAWAEEILTLRAAISRSVELAEEVKSAFVDLHGPERGEELYRMICGYSAEQIGATPEEWQTGALRQLVEWLNSPYLEYRVLASYNLEEITDLHFFSPASKPQIREREYRKMLSRLEEGRLGPKQADSGR